MRGLKIVPVHHGSCQDSVSVMDAVCHLSLDVCGSDRRRTVSLPSHVTLVFIFRLGRCHWYVSACLFDCRQYMVAIPAVLEAGADARFCASLMQPNETVVMTVVMMSAEKNTTVLKETSSEAFHKCIDFKVSFKHHCF